ncbi:MAG: histidinol-phosphatase HisJ family protein [Candidatus Omnitrophica bacterium]|nr:histidinol-phosphatase HisJ family protein [Candidatus Omnitrophota bacterium]
MKPIIDYHNHTILCGHAIGEPFEYVDQALSLGLKEIGFSDHAPLVCHDDPTVTMSFEQLPRYHGMIEDVQKKYEDKDIKIRLGIEADFVVGFEEKTKAILDGYAYDYVIGSVHFIGDFAFDNPTQKERLKTNNINKVYLDYHQLLRQSAESGLFDIMAHVDLVKKFGDRPTEDLTDDLRVTAEVFKKTGVVIEINSSGLRKPVGEIYPSLPNLKIYCEAGVPITFGSDSHAPNEVGSGFEQAFDLARAAGYSEYVLFEKRQISQKVTF